MTRAAVLHAYNEELRVEEIELSDPRSDEVVVKLAASGVCHTDLSVLQGKLPFPPPLVPGHEGAGIVESVGSAVTHLVPGDAVLLTWVASCGRCPFCKAGRTHLCDAVMNAAATGEENVFRIGDTPVGRLAGVASFAERTVVRASAAIKIPDSVPLDRVCLIGCGVMTGVGAVTNTVRLRAGETAAVLGCGGVGLNVIQGARLAGAGRIIAVDLHPSKLEMARSFGATDTVDASAVDDVPAAIQELTDGLGVDYAFEVIGNPSTIAQAFAAAKRGGKAVVVGATGIEATVTLPAMSFCLAEKSLVGSLYGSAVMSRDMPALVDLYARGRLMLDELVSRRIALEEINDAFRAMTAGEVARSVIVYD